MLTILKKCIKLGLLIMGNVTLIVFEGKITEPDIFKYIEKNFQEIFDEKSTFCISWCSDIVSLYKKIKDDKNLTLLRLLQEKNKSNKELKNLKKDDIRETYLFFDFEGKNNEIPEKKYYKMLKEMLEIFDNETEQGKLYISYPMVEALKHSKKNLKENNLGCIWNLNDKKSYKEYIGRIIDYSDIRKLNRNDWQQLISLCVQKTSRLIYGQWKIPKHKEIAALEQIEILKHQYKFITEGKVVSLSAFPLFILNNIREGAYNKLQLNNYKKNCKFKCIV